MDVRCTKCGIEYEFDDAKVTAAGVTVKCTSCGHVFKVKREEAPLAAPPHSGSFRADGEWMVKQQGGTIYRFKELTTLQKWIVERKVGRDDEISKTGNTWKRLGDVAELTSFFQVVDAANAALQASVVAAPPSLTPTSMPPLGPSAQQPTAPALRLPNTDSGFGPRSMPAPQSGLEATPLSPAAPAVPVRSPHAATVPPSASQETLDEDDPVLAWQKAKRRRLVAATALLVLSAVVAVGWMFREPLLASLGTGGGAVPPPAVEAAWAALRADRAEARAAARPALDAAAAAPGAPVAALAWQARLDIASAAEQRELARLHAALAAFGGAAAARHEAAAVEANGAADAALAAAYRTVGDVRARAPGLVDGHLAGAAYQLEKAGFAEARGDLEAARKAARPEELSVVDAEIAVQQALADARAALASPAAAGLVAAAERMPQSDDARLRLAQAALRTLAVARQAAAKAPVLPAELAAARALVAALPAPDERATLLGALLDASKAPEPAVTVDAGPAAPDAAAHADAGAPTGAAPDAGVTEDEGVNDPYDVVMQKAERARVNGKSRLAHVLFAKAARQKPTAARPWLGLGWAAMDLGRNTESLRAFKKAVELAPEVGEAHFGLAEAYRFSGDRAAAVAEYREFLRLDPASRDAEVAKRAIESLKD